MTAGGWDLCTEFLTPVALSPTQVSWVLWFSSPLTHCKFNFWGPCNFTHLRGTNYWMSAEARRLYLEKELHFGACLGSCPQPFLLVGEAKLTVLFPQRRGMLFGVGWAIWHCLEPHQHSVGEDHSNFLLGKLQWYFFSLTKEMYSFYWAQSKPEEMILLWRTGVGVNISVVSKDFEIPPGSFWRCWKYFFK